jgi:tetratricopeptide (TPR) repeat protein
MSFNNLANLLPEFGHRGEALRAIEEAFNLDLATSLYTLANLLSELGAALRAVKEVVTLHRPLATAYPHKFNARQVISLNNLAKLLYELGHREEALGAMEEAVELHRQLAT